MSKGRKGYAPENAIWVANQEAFFAHPVNGVGWGDNDAGLTFEICVTGRDWTINLDEAKRLRDALTKFVDESENGVTCPACNGTGDDKDGYTCSPCHGSGRVKKRW